MIAPQSQTRKLTQELRRFAMQLGFDLFGVAPVQQSPELLFFDAWLRRGYAGSMRWLWKQKEKRQNPQLIVPDAKSVIVCATNYNTNAPYSDEAAGAGSGWISRYAWGDDYHKTLKNRIKQLYEFMVNESGENKVGRYYVDTGPVSEKVWAQLAGLGWIGKNTCLINRNVGSFTFLSVIITRLELEYDAPGVDHCGTCSRCIEACPTDALVEPYVLDARKCISYLTIENREETPAEFRDGVGEHIFGCDICQDVCPWNRKSPTTADESFAPRPTNFAPHLKNVLALDEQNFREQFRKSPVKRTKLRGLLRNALVAAGNSGLKRLLPGVEKFTTSEDELLKEHALWASRKLRREIDN